jgi:hypothetical protein
MQKVSNIGTPASLRTALRRPRRREGIKNIAGLFTAAAIGVAALLTSAPAMAGKSPHNWMREFVQLRQLAMAERLLGRQAAADLRSRMSARIVGGTIAEPETHPFQVGLLFKREPDNFFAQYCGGKLIRPDVVVTAAHCSDFVSRGDVQVLTGTQRLDGSGTRRNVARIRIHPDWDPFTSDSRYRDLVARQSGPADPARDARLGRPEHGSGRHAPRHRLGQRRRAEFGLRQAARLSGPSPRGAPAAGFHDELQRPRLI